MTRQLPEYMAGRTRGCVTKSRNREGSGRFGDEKLAAGAGVAGPGWAQWAQVLGLGRGSIM